MNTALASTGIPDMEAQAHQLIERQVQDWFDLCDQVLDIHRRDFLFRQPTPAELADHKTALKQIIRTCLLINARVLDPEFNAPDLASRLQVRIKQLEDAYNTFHDPELSDEKAGRILQQIFPE